MFSAYRFSKSSSFKIAASSNALMHAYTMLPLVSAWCRWLAISASSSRERQICSRSTEDILKAVKEKKESFKLFPRSEIEEIRCDFSRRKTALNLLQPFRYQEWPMSNFSSQCQYIFEKRRNENKDKHQPKDIVWWNTKFSARRLW